MHMSSAEKLKQLMISSNNKGNDTEIEEELEEKEFEEETEVEEENKVKKEEKTIKKQEERQKKQKKAPEPKENLEYDGIFDIETEGVIFPKRSKRGESKGFRYLTVYVSDEEYERAEKIAESHRMTVSMLGRILLMNAK